jgi:hypothetical protein
MKWGSYDGAFRKFVAYFRVSTDKQGRSGLGLEAQREAVLAFLNGGKWTLVPCAAPDCARTASNLRGETV